MKINQNLAAALLMGLASGEYRYRRGITDGNRTHMDRAPRGSTQEAERIAAAEAKRARRAKRK